MLFQVAESTCGHPSRYVKESPRKTFQRAKDSSLCPVGRAAGSKNGLEGFCRGAMGGGGGRD